MTLDLDDIERLTQKVSYLVPNQRLNLDEELFVKVVCRRETILELVRLARLSEKLKRDNALMHEALRRIASTDNEFSWSREELARQALKALQGHGGGVG